MNFEIWSEGYLCTGLEGVPVKAQLLGTATADTFEAACAAWANTLDSTHSRACFDAKTLSFWGCRLFDNENDARKLFG